MPNRLSKIVTKTGDDGFTSLADGSRLNKNEARIHSLGEVDELNSLIGLLLSHMEQSEIQQILQAIQHDLFDLGAELSQPQQQLLLTQHVDYLEQKIQTLNKSLKPLKEFILPGGSIVMGFLHLARSVCRRAERSLVELQQKEQINPLSLQYLNRLSDLLFVMARYLALKTEQREIYWQSRFSG